MSFLGQLSSVYIPTFRLSDIFEIFLLIFLIYKIILGLRNTRAMVILKGILLLFVFYNLAYLFSFEAILVLFQSVITLCIFAIIVVFQPEMRKFLEQMGTKNIAGKLDLSFLFGKSKSVSKYYSDKSIVELSKSCFVMSSSKTGALIVLERDIPLSEYIDTGICVNADVSSQLLINIFEKNTPLHDGAVIQIDDKLVAATCYLPLSSNPSISKHMGTRHRAAIGVSEATDCLVLIVSEESGKVSLVVNGLIHPDLSKESLTSLLYSHQLKLSSSLTSITPRKLSIFRLLTREHLSTKLISCFVGLLGWVLLMNIANPITTLKFEDLPIEFINTSVIEATGKTYELLSSSTVDVILSDRRSVIDKVSKSDISVIADLSKLSYVNAVPLMGYLENYPTTSVRFVEDNIVNVELDSLISKEFDITLDKFVSLTSSSFVPLLSSDLTSVVLSGPKSKIDTIDKIVYTYDVSNSSGVYSGSSTPVVYDRNGDILPNTLFDFSVSSVSAYGDSYPIKEIPLDLRLDRAFVGGYKVANIDFVPRSIKVSGSSKSLSLLSNLVIDMDINIDSSSVLNNQLVKSLSISDYLPSGVYFAGSDDEVLVTLSFESLQSKTITFDSKDVRILGLNPLYTVSLDDSSLSTPISVDSSLSISISGEDSVLSSISKDSILPYIDVTNLTVGKYNMIVQFDGLDSVILTSNISVKLSIVAK